MLGKNVGLSRRFKRTRRITTWAGLCANGDGEESLEKEEKGGQGRGAVSFPGGLSQSEGNSLEETVVVMKTG